MAWSESGSKQSADLADVKSKEALGDGSQDAGAAAAADADQRGGSKQSVPSSNAFSSLKGSAAWEEEDEADEWSDDEKEAWSDVGDLEDDAGPGKMVEPGILAAQQQMAKQMKSEKAVLVDFDPEPLHVRAIFHGERRRIRKELLVVKHHLQQHRHQLKELGRHSHRASKSEPQVEAENAIKRAKYHLKILASRQKRLDDLNLATHEQLPAQLIEAAFDGDHHYVMLCLEAKVGVDVKDARGMTPLIVATNSNKVSIVKMLLAHQADPYIQDNNGAVCAHYAVQLGHIHCMHALLEAFPGQYWDTLTIKDSRGRSAIDYARQPDREPFRQLLRLHLGGSIPILWQIFKGWYRDATSGKPQVVARQVGRTSTANADTTTASRGGYCSCSCSKVEKAAPERASVSAPPQENAASQEDVAAS